MNKQLFQTILFLLFFPLSSYSQTTIKGKIIDENNSPIFAANIYLKSQPQKGVTSDFNGQFL